MFVNNLTRTHELIESAGIPIASVAVDGSLEFAPTATQEQIDQAQQILLANVEKTGDAKLDAETAYVKSELVNAGFSVEQIAYRRSGNPFVQGYIIFADPQPNEEQITEANAIWDQSWQYLRPEEFDTFESTKTQFKQDTLYSRQVFFVYAAIHRLIRFFISALDPAAITAETTDQYVEQLYTMASVEVDKFPRLREVLRNTILLLEGVDINSQTFPVDADDMRLYIRYLILVEDVSMAEAMTSYR